MENEILDPAVIAAAYNAKEDLLLPVSLMHKFAKTETKFDQRKPNPARGLAQMDASYFDERCIAVGEYYREFNFGENGEVMYVFNPTTCAWHAHVVNNENQSNVLYAWVCNQWAVANIEAW
jgi:hypothetical protein